MFDENGRDRIFATGWAQLQQDADEYRKREEERRIFLANVQRLRTELAAKRAPAVA